MVTLVRSTLTQSNFTDYDVINNYDVRLSVDDDSNVNHVLHQQLHVVYIHLAHDEILTSNQNMPIGRLVYVMLRGLILKTSVSFMIFFVIQWFVN